MPPKLRRTLTQKQSSKLRTLFDKYDEGSKNYLTYEEFQSLLESLGKKLTLERCKTMVHKHARQHHEEHYGETNFVEEDIQHISFGLFCIVVKGAAQNKRQRSLRLKKAPAKPVERGWWWTIPFGFRWPGVPKPGDDSIVSSLVDNFGEQFFDPKEGVEERLLRQKDVSAVLSQPDIRVVGQFLKKTELQEVLSSSAISKAKEKFARMIGGGSVTRLQAELFLLETLSPVDGLHLFFWSGTDNRNEGKSSDDVREPETSRMHAGVCV